MSAGIEREMLENNSDAGLRENKTSTEKPQRLLMIGSGYEDLYGMVTKERKDIYDQTTHAPILLGVWSETESGNGNERKLNERKSIEYIVSFAMARSDKQNTEGEQLGIFPVGSIVKPPKEKGKGRQRSYYTYQNNSSLPEYTFSERKYEAIEITDVNKNIRELFPQTVALSNFAESLDNLSSMNGSQPDNSSLYARTMFSDFNGKDKKPNGDIYTVNVDGVPIIVCSDEGDLANFTPYTNVMLPEGTNVISFPVSEHSRGRGGIFQDSIAVVCTEGVDETSISQHLNSQMIFRAANLDKNDALPIFYSKEITDKDNIMEDIAKKYALSFLLKHDKNVKWIGSPSVDMVYSDRSDVIVAENTVIHGFGKLCMQPESAYYLGDLLSNIEIVFDNTKSKNQVINTTGDYLNEAIEFLKEMSIQRPSREFQLFAASYLSSYQLEDWGNAFTLFDNWEGKEKLIKSLGIPRMLKK